MRSLPFRELRVISHILVGIDGSAPSRRAASFAHDLAQQTGASITLLFVLEPPHVVPIAALDAFAISSARRTPAELEAVRKLLDAVAADLPKAKVEKDIEFGDAAATLVDQAEKRHADLVVIGARGASAGERWLLGSVTDRVVHHAKCPVTVVR
jgi:nucleotide-binding universal stress UspA family protein